MSQGDIISLAQEAMKMVLMLSSPMLIFGLLVGLAVSIFQATTQIQEATLAFVPKIVAVLISFLIFSPWLLSLILDFTNKLFENMNAVIK